MKRAILVQRRLRGDPINIEELRSLAESAGYEVVGSMVQTRNADSKYQIGRGKSVELAQLVKQQNATQIIFDNDLSITQVYNLAKRTGVEVIDRFKLILEIFSERASTLESKLQIRLANLRYLLPRAREAVRLAREEEQPGFHGLGKYQVDIYYDMIKTQIHDIEQKLERISRKRSIHRKRRMDLGYFLVSLAGYTNAGKSTLFKTLTEEDVTIDDALFTTLSTTTRRVEFDGRICLLTDTVGFIDRLPLTLVSSFLSTLTETIFSDLIILVVDISEPVESIRGKIDCCMKILEEIGASHIPTLLVFNKRDLLSQMELEEKITALQPITYDFIIISALRRDNMDDLEKAVVSHLSRYFELCLTLPLRSETLSFLSWLYDRIKVLEVTTRGSEMHIRLEAPPKFVGEIQGYVERFNGQIRTENYLCA